MPRAEYLRKLNKFGFRFGAILAGFLFLGAVTCRAQVSVATLYGTVTDPAGAAVPDATVTVSNPATGYSVSTKTQADGSYEVPALPPATYTVTVEQRGFSTSVQTGITLQVNQKALLDVQLKVGTLATTVEVAATAPLVQTATATIGAVVTAREVVELPLNTRRFGQLGLLMPGTVPDRGGFSSVQYGSPFSETTYAANGTRGGETNILIDGMDAKNFFSGSFSIQPSPDAVQEFKVQTESFSAVFGKNAGSTINLVTKSGTNQIHGSAFEFLRNDKLDARNFFTATKPSFRRNQFGAYAGGPIIKNKTFVFGGYEGMRQRKGGTFAVLVPTPAMLGGDFSALLPDTPIIDPLTCPDPPSGATCQAFSGNMIPADRISSVALKVVPYFPAPNAPGVANFITNPKAIRDDNQFSTRVDHTFGPKDNLYFRYLLAQSSKRSTEGAYTVLPGFGTTLRFRGQNIAVGWSHAFSPTMLNEVVIGFSRNSNLELCAACPRAPGFIDSFGIANLHALSPKAEAFPYFSFDEYAGIGDPGYHPLENNDMLEKYNDILTITKGKHTIQTGFDIQPYQRLRTTAPFNAQGQFSFSGLYSNHTISDFLLGYPSEAGRSLQEGAINQDGKFWNFFVQDDFKATKKLTLNLALRYEYHQLPTDRRDVGTMLFPIPGKPWFEHGNAMLIVPGYAQADSICNLPQYFNAEGDHLVACSSDMKKYGFAGRTARTLTFPDRFNWAPRIGLAWRPTSSNRLVVRAGYGMFFALSQFNGFNYQFNDPFHGATQDTFYLANVTPTATLQNAFIGGGAIPLTETLLSIQQDAHFRQPYIHEWTFNIESQLSASTALEVRYVGLGARQQSHFHQFGNQPIPGSSDIISRTPYPDFGVIENGMTSGVNSSYNSMQVQLSRRMSQGLNFLASYTWAKSIASNEGEEDSENSTGRGQNDNNDNAERGRSVNDARQRFVFSSIYELPVGRGKRWASDAGGVANAFLGGWQVQAITSFQTGFPITIRTSKDVANTGSGNWRPDRLCNGSLPTGQRTVDHWFDASCFTLDLLNAALAAGMPRFGNSGSRILDGPGFQNWDFSFIKNNKLTERIKLQFRAEFFNGFNQAHFGDPRTKIRKSSTGKIFSASEPRDIQFGLKFIW